MSSTIEIDVSEYNGIATDSRLVKPGFIFICVQGFDQDGHNFAKEAVKNGAKLVVATKKIKLEVPVVLCPNGREAAVYLSDKFYDNPSSKLNLIGITGTNGKSSVCFLTHKLLSNLGYKVGAIGTGKYLIGNQEHRSQRTTPDVVELRSILAQMVQAKVDYVLMEVSSHAIALHRVDQLDFDFVCFTNLSQDHLDFHKNMQAYAEVKLGFVKKAVLAGATALVNSDDSYGSTLDLPKVKRISNFDKMSDYYYEKREATLKGCKFLLNGNLCVSSLLGEVNLFNSAFILSLVDLLVGKIFPSKLQSIESLAGRYNLLSNNVLVDYAHSPDSLEKVLQFAKRQSKRRVITLFGCGGNRDKQKRAIMGKLAVNNSDLVILCEDNSRKERTEEIITEIVGDASLNKIIIIKSRKKAIDYGLSITDENDLFLVLGRGAETVLDRGFEQLQFSDLEYLKGAITPCFKKMFDPLWVEFVLNAKFSQDFDANFVFDHLSTDSRSLRQNSLFIALPGKKYDSYQFLADVLKVEGCCAIVGKDCPQKSEKLLVVDSTVEAYQSLAKAYLGQFQVSKIGITGSVGKTTTKEMLYNLLKQNGLTLKTDANENNQIGVPKTIFNLHPDHKYLLIEMGTDHPGEIEKLAQIVNPDIGIITNIGESHLATFGDKQGVYREKKKLFDFSKKKLAADKRFFADGLEYSSKVKGDQLWVSVEEQSFKLGNQPKFRAQSAALAIKTALLLGLSKDAIQLGLLLPLDMSNRLECKKIGEVNFIFDCYNANPLSMESALEFWENYKKGQRHLAILGEMLELGASAVQSHQEIGSLVNGSIVYGVGTLAKYYNPQFFYESIKELQENLPKLENGDVVLVKGSNGVGLSVLKNIFIKKLEG